MQLHPVPEHIFCVPGAIVALTGADPESVVYPALNRATRAEDLLEPVGPSHVQTAIKVLEELGYRARPYKKPDLRVTVAEWAERSLRYPGRSLLIRVPRHVLVIQDGRVHDTFAEFGIEGSRHAYAKHTVDYCALVEPR
jgi:hypothetical protein